MARKPLNAEEIAELRSSPYVASIIGSRIRLKPEFKRMTYNQIACGKTMREVFEEHAISFLSICINYPKILQVSK